MFAGWNPENFLWSSVSIISTPLANSSLELSALPTKPILFNGSIPIIKDSREKKSEGGERSLVYSQIIWEKVVQNILRDFVLTICSFLVSRQSLPCSLTDYYVQNGYWKLSALRNACETYKMSLFRPEHIIPAKFVGLKPLSIGIKRPPSLLK